jgi:hypothetical protein
MVDDESPVSLAALSSPMTSPSTQRKPANGPEAKLLQGSINYSGLDLEKEPRSPVEAEVFS